MFLLMIDNYDSFTHNLVQLFYEFDLQVQVYRNDRITLSEIEHLKPDWICISPGPKDPAHAGISKDVIRRFSSTIPILGVCLGMQAINEVFGGLTVKAPEPVHGKRSRIEHNGRGIFSDLPSPLWVARYHSLQAVVRSPRLLPLAYAADRVVMAIQHDCRPLCGVQFHPESFLSECGCELAANFLALQPKWRTTYESKSGRKHYPSIGPPRIGKPLFKTLQDTAERNHP
ncbi:MAG TPA: aminodeoxychorismate/anthranilate synthase component II [Syntrophobacteraceae bacterium]|nr:aminodeoxychorismate/anthranilate synthase component II [Syntrophobacteraceae bacterium]